MFLIGEPIKLNFVPFLTQLGSSQGTTEGNYNLVLSPDAIRNVTVCLPESVENPSWLQVLIDWNASVQLLYHVGSSIVWWFVRARSRKKRKKQLAQIVTKSASVVKDKYVYNNKTAITTTLLNMEFDWAFYIFAMHVELSSAKFCPGIWWYQRQRNRQPKPAPQRGRESAGDRIGRTSSCCHWEDCGETLRCRAWRLMRRYGEWPTGKWPRPRRRTPRRRVQGMLWKAMLALRVGGCSLYRAATLKGSASVALRMSTAQTASTPADLPTFSQSLSMSCFAGNRVAMSSHRWMPPDAPATTKS